MFLFFLFVLEGDRRSCYLHEQQQLNSTTPVLDICNQTKISSDDAQRCVRDGVARKGQVRNKATAAVIKCSEHSALDFGSYAPLRHSWGPWGSWWRWLWLSKVSSHCERLLLQKMEFKEPIAISISCPSQLLDLTEDISAAHLGWGEAEGGKHVTSLRQRRWWFGHQSNKAGQSSANSTVQKWGKQSELEYVVYASYGSGVTLGVKWLLEAVQSLPHSGCGGRSRWRVTPPALVGQ